MEQTSEKQTTTPLTLEQRIEAIEARQHAIAIAFTIALEELAKIDDAELSQDQRPWDPTKINWIDKVGNKGPYQQSNDANNPE